MTGSRTSTIGEAQSDDLEQGQARPLNNRTPSASEKTGPETGSDKPEQETTEDVDSENADSENVDDEEEEDVPYNVSDRHLPWLLRPTPNEQTEGTKDDTKDGPKYWVSEKLLTRDTLGLFYDVSQITASDCSTRCAHCWGPGYDQLAFIAILSSFTQQHPLSSWSTLANFFGFFVLLWWGWYAQIHYDVHFETEDAVHRLFKLLQLLGLGFLAGATGGWDLGKVGIASYFLRMVIDSPD